ncbi:MAG: TonB-dependent receptor [Bacteroidales bacterium]
MRKYALTLVSILLWGSQFVFGQTIITGTVKDVSDGTVLMGATVAVPGTAVGTITNNDGSYSLKVPVNANELIFKYVGMISQTVPINGRTVIDVDLDYDAMGLEEVVVVGYGTQQKTTITGSVSEISNELIMQAPQANISNALVGRMTGLLTVQREGEPGENETTLRIRGQGTFSGSLDPLVIIDGIEAKNYNNLDPNEIENITILKDASATAVYGVRGANGVIIITTKRGELGRPKLSITSNMGFNTWTALKDNTPSYPYSLAYNEALRYNSYTTGVYTPKFTDEDIEHYRTGDDPIFYPDVDWMDLFFKKTALQTNHNVNISGGTKLIKYFVSAGYFFQEAGFNDELAQQAPGFNAQNTYQRYNLRSNFDFNISKRLTASLQLSEQIERKKGIDTGYLLDKVFNMPPWPSPGLVDGKIVNVYSIYGGDVLEQFLGRGYNLNTNNYLTTSLRFDYKLDFITEGLNMHSTISYWNRAIDNKSYSKNVQTYKPLRLPDGSILYASQNEDEPFRFGEYAGKLRKNYFEAGLDYSRKFGNHNVGGLVLYNQDKLYDPNLAYVIPNGHQGLVGRVTYNYALRYLFEFNIGYNGTENFAVGQRFGFFPAYSLGWIVTQEPFFPQNNVITYLKIRATYGEVGNDRIGGDRFLYRPAAYEFGDLENWAEPQYYFFGVPGSTFQQYQGSFEGANGNPNLTWERAEKTNIGADVTLFTNKLNISGDYFYEYRNNILAYPNTIPNILAADLAPQNWGEMENEGFELEVNYRDANGGFNYWANAVYTFAKNTILFQDEVERPFTYQNRTGQSYGQFFGLINEGFYNTWGDVIDAYRPRSQYNGNRIMPGDFKYKDINGDGFINEDDQIPMGYSSFPEIIFGLSFGVSYKGFGLSVLFQGADRVSRYAGSRMYRPFAWESAITQYINDNSWTPEKFENGENIEFPHLSADGIQVHSYQPSNWWIQNSRYVRLKNIEVSYNFSSQLLKKANISSARVFVNGHNLLTWDNLWPGDDPEQYTSGSNYGYYPITRTINLGINVSF